MHGTMSLKLSDVVTLKLEAGCSSETYQTQHRTRCNNPADIHLSNTRRGSPKTYNNYVPAALNKNF